MSTLNLFDNSGIPLAYLIAIAPRSWVNSKEGTCKFAISRNDAAALEENLQYGNLVTVEHAKLPGWVGVIDIDPDQRDWTLGEIRCTAYSAERLLRRGVTPVAKTISGTAGGCFLKLLDYYNENADIIIQPGEISLQGSNRMETLGDDCYVHAYKIAQRSGMEFDITYGLDSKGRLQLYGNWYEKRSNPTGLMLHSRVNIELREPMYSEVGPVYNMVWGVSDAQTDGKRIEKGPYIDQTSIDTYGKRPKKVIFNGLKTDEAVEASALSYLDLYKAPRKNFPVGVLDIGEVWNSMEIGAVYPVWINAGFADGRMGISGAVRIAGFKYEEAAQRVDINAAG